METLSEADNFRYNIGNYFLTEKECEEYKKRLLIEQQLKDIALRLNEGKKIGWEDHDQKKYHIYYNHYSEEFDFLTVYYHQIECIYCLSNKLLEVALEDIGEEDLKSYFGVK